VLDDEGCLNAFLPTDLFLSTATHLALGMRFRVLRQYLGNCCPQWQFPSLLGSWDTLIVSYSIDSSSVRLQVLVITLVRMY